MPTLAGQLGMQAAGIGMGLLLEKHNDRRQAKQTERLGNIQLGLDRRMTDYQFQKQMEMWEKTNYSAQMEQLRKAGLNPGLIYGMSGGGGTTTGGGAAHVSTPNAPTGGGEIMGLTMQAIQARMADAQTKLLEAQTKKTEAETEKTAGVDTDYIKAQTENTILQQLITKYTGLEQQRVYERIKKPNTGIEAKTWQEELEARQGIAGTIYELWVEGKLKDKSVAEIEQILLANAKTREETKQIYKQMELLEENIKGAKLDNIIKDLEAQLQTKTGIDRSSPGWLKILGRLFVQLFNK